MCILYDVYVYYSIFCLSLSKSPLPSTHSISHIQSIAPILPTPAPPPICIMYITHMYVHMKGGIELKYFNYPHSGGVVCGG